ncbi:uncharacterized protein [Medicago truncatula]|uniref:uncharacterized protein n=1 Tax=Medicago truncatula TaxID=3880 RepID=UPI0019683753|nr:uncharacterized protein LOC112417384 [Medicago truncatula]
MLVDRVGLWYSVLVARYGKVGGRLELGGRSCSSWWREVGRIRDGDGGVGGSWFGDSVRRKVGDGTDTLFWQHWWCGRAPLRELFPRLFDLAMNKDISVANMFSLRLLRGGEGWSWRRRRRLWAWEEVLLEECRALLLDVSLFPNISDSWVWLPDTIGGFTVRGAYKVLTATVNPNRDSALDLVWHHQVPLKISIFAWRLIRDRLPTRANLAACGILQLDTALCVAGCGMIETADHLFLSCLSFAVLWEQVRHWIGCVGVDSNTISHHFVQFTSFSGFGKVRRSFLQLLWLLTSWVIWNERNIRLFKNVITEVPRLLDKIKLLSLAWLKAKNATFVLELRCGGQVLWFVWALANHRRLFPLDFVTVCSLCFVVSGLLAHLVLRD